MSKEMGPRERQLRQQREANYEASQRKMREAKALVTLAPIPKPLKAALQKRIDEASKKTGKSRKVKK